MSDSPPAEARPVAPLWTILAMTAVVAAAFFAFHLEAEWWLDLGPDSFFGLYPNRTPCLALTAFRK